MTKLLVICGSLRKESFNKKLAKIASKIIEIKNIEYEFIDLNEYPLEIYNQDVEESQGLPENAIKLKRKMIDSDGFIICSPEYNSSISACLKNMIDWTSRKHQESENSLIAYKHKYALLLSASPGALGGMRGIFALRSIMLNIGCFVYPDFLSVNNAYNKFDDKGNLSDANDTSKLETIVNGFFKFIK